MDETLATVTESAETVAEKVPKKEQIVDPWTVESDESIESPQVPSSRDFLFTSGFERDVRPI
jgi:hypothetical protein